MRLLQNQVVLMLAYALLTGLFFALLWKKDKKDRVRFFFIVVCALIFGGIAVSWLMYPFPLR